MQKRVALITGGMGGLGETISTKMADAGYTVAVTYSPSNKTSGEWLAEQKAKGYEFQRLPLRRGDFDSCARPASRPSSRTSARSTSWSTTPASPRT